MDVETALVFDDDHFFRTLLSDILSGMGLQVISYASHSLFLSQLCESRTGSMRCPDFILTDNQLPEMTGLEFLSQIKQMGCTTPGHRIAIISGRWNEDDTLNAKALGCEVFDKFNSPEQIHKWIKNARTRS